MMEKHQEEISRYLVGIDLGTTNSAVAYVDREAGSRTLQFFAIPQLTAASKLNARLILPSFCYLPGKFELPEGSSALPWDAQRDWIVGEFAREQGALVPNHLVSSAKSWLCHPGVDRSAEILPWGIEGEVRKLSPVQASTRYLAHIKEAWNHIFGHQEGGKLEEQRILLTVPASFDEVARELTVKAAQEAGLRHIVLLEEPLAAFYAWLAEHEKTWKSKLKNGQLILVCDVGGGTTDFTVVAVKEGEKGLRFDRLAVGEHLMLGGDNMDIDLARFVEGKMTGKPGSLDTRRWRQLMHQCRQAKERLLDEHAPEKVDVTLVGAGSKLIGGTLKVSLERSRVQDLLLEDFFPRVSFEDQPKGGGSASESGLPYVADTAVTRHLAQFWRRYQDLLGKETGRAHVYPDWILFNGGALTPAILRNRIQETVRGWFHAEGSEVDAPQELPNPKPELAVAMGAAYYGLVRIGAGVRVGAGSPRSYYVEVASANAEGVRQTVCLLPRGTEEGFGAMLQEPGFQALANQPVRFQIFSSTTRLGDQLGEPVALRPEECSVMPPIRTVLRFGKKGEAKTLPVHLGVRLSEIGTLELTCRADQTEHVWQLTFDVRQEPGQEAEAQESKSITFEREIIEKAQNLVKTAFLSPLQDARALLEGLPQELSNLLDLKKARWPIAVLRGLADTLLEIKESRLRSALHEAKWLNLAGFCLRPGYGDALDEFRMKEVWKFFLQGVSFVKEAPCRLEWWIFWRRVAGGLTVGHQTRIYQEIASALQGAKGKKLLNNQEEVELWAALGNFERLPAQTKLELGKNLLKRLQKGKPAAQDVWVLSRLGGRIPLYGPLDRTVPLSEVAHWFDVLLSLDLTPTDATAHALLQLARKTGDRSRDLPDEQRDRLAAWLEPWRKSEPFLALLRKSDSILAHHEQERAFGEALPSGLMLAASE